jgi:hypothetical protein
LIIPCRDAGRDRCGEAAEPGATSMPVPDGLDARWRPGRRARAELPNRCADKPTGWTLRLGCWIGRVRRSGGRKLGASSDAQTRLALYRQGRRYPRYGYPSQPTTQKRPSDAANASREGYEPVAHTATTGVHSGKRAARR